MIFVDSTTVGWRSFLQAWLESKKDVKVVLEYFIEKYLDKILMFKKRQCFEPVPITDFSAIKTFVAIYDSIAFEPEANLKKYHASETAFSRSLEKWFLFCLIWSVGGAVNETGRVLIDHRLREIDPQFMPLRVIYEYYIDPKSNEFEPWEEKVPSIMPKSCPYYDMVIPTIDTLRYSHIIASLTSTNHRVLMCGSTGSGKTTMAINILSTLPQFFSGLTLNLSASTKSSTVQSIIESSLEKRSKDKLGPKDKKKRLIIFIDDLNMPKKTSTQSPSQPPLELIRQLIDHHGWYNREKSSWQHIFDCHILSAMTSSNGRVIPSRIQSRFNIINFVEPAEQQIVHIFQTILNSKFQSFPLDIKLQTVSIVKLMCRLYNEVKTNFLQTPNKPHFLFNIYDLSRVFQGILQIDKEHINSQTCLFRLCLHEFMRNFSDRFSQNDETRFTKILKTILLDHFGTDCKDLMTSSLGDNWNGPIYSSITDDDDNTTFRGNSGAYREMCNEREVMSLLRDKLATYNSNPINSHLDLVLFEDAIKHILRIYRVIQLERGNMSLIGNAGTGRETLSRIASNIAGAYFSMFEVTDNYIRKDFLEGVKTIHIKQVLRIKPLFGF